jgi:hypothetical protein
LWEFTDIIRNYIEFVLFCEKGNINDILLKNNKPMLTTKNDIKLVFKGGNVMKLFYDDFKTKVGVETKEIEKIKS